MSNYLAAERRTLYFIGVTTGSSSIMKVFPAWAEHLGLNAVIKGIGNNVDLINRICGAVEVEVEADVEEMLVVGCVDLGRHQVAVLGLFTGWKGPERQNTG